MLAAIIKNADNTYEHLYKINNDLVSIHIDNNGVSLSDNSYINNIISKFRYNNSYEYISDFSGYKVYYDPTTGFKHFILNGTEDYNMFFRFNGVDAIRYKGIKENSKKDENAFYNKMFKVLGTAVIVVSSSFLIFLASQYDMNVNFSVNTVHNVSDLIQMYQNDIVDYKDAINCINSSNLPDDVKTVICDESFLKMIFSYYDGTPLKYSSSIKFNDLQMESFDNYTNGNDPNVLGYYECFNPNILHSKIGQSGESETKTLIHEFIHLLQAEGSPYNYLDEAVAELMTTELLDSQPITYFDAIDNLKLLIDIIGPEPIYELSFGGDDTSLNDILRMYLPSKDIITLKYYLQKLGQDINEKQEISIEIRKILYKLYENKYGKPIEEDENIISVLNDSNTYLGKKVYKYDERKFLLPNKMHEEEKTYAVNVDKSVLAQKGYLVEKKCYKKLDKLDESSYDSYKDSDKVELQENLNKNGMIAGKIIKSGEKAYYKHLKTPIKEEDYELFSFRKLPSDNYDIKDAIKRGYISAYKVSYFDEKVDGSREYIYYESNNPNISITDNSIEFNVKGIKSRFGDQCSKIARRMNATDYHK